MIELSYFLYFLVSHIEPELKAQLRKMHSVIDESVGPIGVYIPLENVFDYNSNAGTISLQDGTELKIERYS